MKKQTDLQEKYRLFGISGKEFSKKRFRSQNITPTKSAIAQAEEPPEDFCRENAARSFIQVHPDMWLIFSWGVLKLKIGYSSKEWGNNKLHSLKKY